ncbi:MAG: hypothetical protein L6243_05435 [Candidatus Altiarchaeales archaeon]|nr:hypothetical protein [Candidatus Altiarchaeota archaeon]MBU4342005.1 hypothetical protein [Candidatus Altiarchaeota archaeon]MBU4437158.1 hypothetical protein [Candidatus Altiarchaeota archaeon]MCG2783014.1 hypothetical protein [Candidatus Altiarchaeales archaeon]
MQDSKGQGAMEYLMNYGWVIVIVVIIGASLWYLGIFDLEQSATSYEGFTRIRPLVESVIFTTDGDFAARFVNGAGNLITINNISVVNHDGTECHCTIQGSSIIRAGIAFDMGGTACSADHNVGDPFLIYLTINYTMSMPGMDIEKVENGTIRGRYGGAIGDVIPADTDIQGCFGVSGYWLGNQYCLGGDNCAQKPKCCGDDPAEYYKSSWSTVCCAQESSCGSFLPSHYCWSEGTPGSTAGQSNVYMCDDGGWLDCPSAGECNIENSYICTQNSGTWLWRESPANDDPDRCSGNTDGWSYCSGDTAQNRNYYCSGESCTYSVAGSDNCNGYDGCSGDEYRDYYCSGGSCPYSGDDCSDCSCSCGDYNEAETTANGNCADGKDNDCDGPIDGADPGCF